MKTYTLTFKPGTPESVIEWLRKHPDVASFDCAIKQSPDPDGWIPHTTEECPCNPDLVIQTIVSWESYPSMWDPEDRPASRWDWSREAGITHWRPVKS